MPQILKYFSALLFVCFGLQLTVHPQSVTTLKREADASFKKGNYYDAAKRYAAILYDSPLVNKAPVLLYPFQPSPRKKQYRLNAEMRAELQFSLAESYRLYGHFKEALPQYEKYIASKDERHPQARLWYADCLLANDMADKASIAYSVFLQAYRHTDSFQLKAKNGLANTQFVLNQKKMPTRASLDKLPQYVSSNGSNFGLQKTNDEQFLFTSSRHVSEEADTKPLPVHLYSGGLDGKPIEMISGFPVDMNTGSPSVSADGLTLYFTAWKEGATGYKIYRSTRNNKKDNWGMPKPLPDMVNMPGYQSKHPFITPDEKYLLFVSDRPGGFGKNDIWCVAMDKGEPVGAVKNAGAAINTPGNEASPFYDAEKGELYFSSDGRVGMGGMDIYKVSGELSELRWKEPTQNLGYPFNSVKDDLYFSKQKNSDTAYLSSDRASSCCMELFRAVALHYSDSLVKKKEVPANMQVKTALLKETIPVEPKRSAVDSVNALTLDRLHVNYRFASAAIRKEDRPQLEKLVRMLEEDTALNLLVASFTDCIGSKNANKLLSRKRSESVKKYLLAKGVAANRINLDFFGKQHPLLACREDSSYRSDAQIVNRRSDLIVTLDKHPVWIPSGKELDMDHTASYNMLVANKTTVPGKDNSLKAGENLTVSPSGNSRSSAKKGVTIVTPASANENDALKKKTVDSIPAKTGSSYRVAKNADAVRSKQPVTDQREKTTAKLKTGKTTGESKKVETVNTGSETKKNKPGTLIEKLLIASLIEPMPKLKAPDIVTQMTKRTPQKSFEIYTTSDSVKVELYDNGVYDKDSVSVIFNKELVAYKEELRTNRPVTFYVKLSIEVKRNEMIFFAENLGLTPPNSALMIITDGENKRTEINVASDLEHNAVIYFIKVKK